jgi:precorrin-6A/cobalt-precorrin-6A reductase
LPLPTRVGGFGGEEGFRAYLDEAGITAILDATHPFATRISGRAARVAQDLGLPYVRFDRPEWRPGPDDLWIVIASEEEAAEHLAPDATVFLATGRQTLERFANLGDRRVYCRQIDPPDREFPLKNGGYVIGRPPFSEEDEIKLFRELEVDALVVKNAGGTRSRSKLDAARALGLPVLMIARPDVPAAPTVRDVAAALDWAVATCA